MQVTEQPYTIHSENNDHLLKTTTTFSPSHGTTTNKNLQNNKRTIIWPQRVISPQPVHSCTLCCNFPISKVTQIPTFTFVVCSLRISRFLLLSAFGVGSLDFRSHFAPHLHKCSVGFTHMKSCSTSCKERRMKTKKACALFR